MVDSTDGRGDVGIGGGVELHCGGPRSNDGAGGLGTLSGAGATNVPDVARE